MKILLHLKNRRKILDSMCKGEKGNDKISRKKTIFKDYSNVTIHMS